MTASPTDRMIDHCLSLDHTATQLYRKFADHAENDDLQSFWQTIATDNAQHRHYWDRLLGWAHKGMLNNLFDDPEKTRVDLSHLERKVRELVDGCGVVSAGGSTTAAATPVSCNSASTSWTVMRRR